MKYQVRPGSQSGQTLAEFALVAPCAVFLLAGLLQAGWLAWGGSVARTAAARALRAAAVAPPASRSAIARLTAWREARGPGIRPLWVSTLPLPANRLAVTVRVLVPRLVPLLSRVASGGAAWPMEPGSASP